MAGVGPSPKDPNKRARRNSGPDLRVITATPTKQPALPVIYEERYEPNMDDWKRVRFTWPAQTRAWWKMWDQSPLAKEFTANDWSELLDTALLHAKFWNGNTSLASELRLRVAKFGATPEDRARLRITFAAADEADDKRATPKPSSRGRRGPLTSVPKSS